MNPVREPPARPEISLARRPVLRARQRPVLLVAVDDSPASYAALVWALREAARREASVVAVSVFDDNPGSDRLTTAAGASQRAPASEERTGARSQASGHRPLDSALPTAQCERVARQQDLERCVARATAETGISGRVRTAVLDPLVYAALVGAAGGADLVVVGSHGKTLLRPAVPRLPARRLPRGT